MARKIEAYVDTSALIAFADQSDTHHPLFRRLFANPPGLLTTPLVVTEGVTEI
jgi:predicted nucleic acid-binding protein